MRCTATTTELAQARRPIVERQTQAQEALRKFRDDSHSRGLPVFSSVRSAAWHRASKVRMPRSDRCEFPGFRHPLMQRAFVENSPDPMQADFALVAGFQDEGEDQKIFQRH